MNRKKILKIIRNHPAVRNSLNTAEEWYKGFETEDDFLHTKQDVYGEIEGIRSNKTHTTREPTEMSISRLKAVEDYANGHEFFDDLDEECIELVKDALIDEIEQAFTDNCPRCSEPLDLDENQEAKCEGCRWRTMILPRETLNKMLDEGQALFSGGEAITPITYIQRPYDEDTVIVSLPDLDLFVLETLKRKAPSTAEALEKYLIKGKEALSWEEKNLLRQFRAKNAESIKKKIQYLEAKQAANKFLQGQTI